jgi:MFS family permease
MKDDDQQSSQSTIKPDEKTIFQITNKNIYYVFAIFAFSSVVINMSNGAFSALMPSIETKLKIESTTDLGLVSSMFFIGQVIGCIVCLFIIEYNIRKLLFIVYLALCFGAVLTIGLVSNYYVLMFLRLTNGIGAAYICIFNPVWIDQYGSKTSASVLMSVHNLSSIIGTVFGFVMASALNSNGTSWNLSYFIQSFILAGCTFLIILIKLKYFDRRMMRIKQSDNFVIYSEENKKLGRNLVNVTSQDQEIVDSSNADIKENDDNKRSSTIKIIKSDLTAIVSDLVVQNSNKPSLGMILKSLIKNSVSFLI